MSLLLLFKSSGKFLAAEAGTYAVTGSNTAFRRGLRVMANAGAYVITGVATTIRATRKITTDAGSYVLTGVAVTFRQGYILAVDAGVYVVTGVAANFPRTYIFLTAVGSYAVTGIAAATRATRIFHVDAGVYALTGVAVVFLKGFVLAVEAGVYAVTGASTTFRRTVRMIAEVGSYLITGAIAMFDRNSLHSTTLYVNGTNYKRYLVALSDEVEDVLRDEPNLYTFQLRGVLPIEGQSVTLTRGPQNDIEFAGNILTVVESADELAENIIYTVTAQDPTWKFNRRRVTKRWTNTSATTIVNEIISGYTSGFTNNNVVVGLPTITEFECINERPSEALGRLAGEIGGYTYIDYGNPITGVLPDVHFYLTETVDAPDDLLPTTPFGQRGFDLQHTGDLTQVRNRILATGGGTTTAEIVETTQTIIPLVDASMFEAAPGGSAIAASNILAYTNKHDGGLASTVAGNTSSPGGSAPTAAVTPNEVGVLVGNKQYKVAFGNSQGETIPGAASNIATGVAFSPPSGANVSATSSVIGALIGAYVYVVTYVTNLGETSAGSQFGRTATALAAPGAASVSAGSTIGSLIGAYNYRIVYRTQYGLTAGGTVFSRTAVATTTPSGPSVSAVSNTMGNLIGAYGYKVVTVNEFGQSAASSAGSRTANAQGAPSAPGGSNTAGGPLIGSYGWKVSFVAADGRETLGSANTATLSAVTAAIQSVSGTGGTSHHYRVSFYREGMGETAWSSVSSVGSGPHTITVSGLPTDCGWKLYSTGHGFTSSDPYYHVATIAPGNTSYAHTTASGNEAQSPVALLGQFRQLTSIPTGPSGTVARRLYRTRAGGSAYYLMGEIGDNSTTSFTDRVPDSSLTIGAPVVNLNGEQHSITSIATGPTGTLYRDIYRTEAGGSIYYLLRRIGDNSTTSFTDNATDAELNKAVTAPSVATSGDQHSITSIPLGPTGVLSRLIYRTKAGGSIYYPLVEVGDNVTTSFVDNIPDSGLGADVAPTVSTAGGESHTLTSIPTGPTGTLARNIYRTVAGGTSFRFVGQLTDNFNTTYIDNLADSELSNYVPVVNTAGANKITLTNIPIGGAGVTERVIYRLDLADGIYKYVNTIKDNTTTTYVDNKPDSSLGRPALTVGTIGASVGDTTLTLTSIPVGMPSAGWIETNGQLIRYGAINVSTLTLTGIPATGIGAILAAISGGNAVVTLPFISGVTGVLTQLERGVDIRLYVVRNDLVAQAAMAAAEGGDGIHEGVIDDSSLMTQDGLIEAADAELEAYKNKLRTITFPSRDVKLRSGKTVTINLPSSPTLVGSFLIQRVISNQFNISRGVFPLRTVTAAPILLTFKDVVNRKKYLGATER